LAKALGQEPAASAVAEKRDLLERLLARLAHEVRNPLGSLDIHFQLLDEDLAALDPDRRNQLAPRLEIIRGELHRLERIMDHFLKLAGPSELDLEPIDLTSVVNHVVELLRPEAASRQIRIQADVAPVPQLFADSVRLTQALLNLVINAMQAVDRDGKIEVTLTRNADAVAIRVRDSGPGLPEDKMSVLFDPYFTTKAEGNGLGLWIAQKIVIAHGGTLQARNAPGSGAEFTLLLPHPPVRKDGPLEGRSEAKADGGLE